MIIKPGDLTFTASFDLHGRFENGRWVNDATPIFDYFRGNVKEEPPKFNIKAKYKVDYFEDGVCTHSEDKEEDLGDFVLEQLEEMKLW